MRWYHKLLVILLVIVYSPVIITSLIIAGLSSLIQKLKDKKAYKSSEYYKNFGSPFKTNCIYRPEYIFYNSVKKRNFEIEYIKQKSNDFEYFILDNRIFIFPDFDQIEFNKDEGIWKVDYDGDWKTFDEIYAAIVGQLDTGIPSLDKVILIERNMFWQTNLNEFELPKNVFLTWSYESAFENEDSPLKMIIPQNSKELFEMMSATPELCGTYELVDDSIIWHLYDKFDVEIGATPPDCYIGIGTKKFKINITHWHPSTYEIYKEVCDLGKKGNVLVIKTFMGGERVIYCGNELDCPYSPSKKSFLGKFYYLTSK